MGGLSSPTGAVAVAEFIAESPRLLRLDLRENEIKTGGLMALSLALKVNHSLLRLDLDRDPKKESVSCTAVFFVHMNFQCGSGLILRLREYSFPL